MTIETLNQIIDRVQERMLDLMAERMHMLGYDLKRDITFETNNLREWMQKAERIEIERMEMMRKRDKKAGILRDGGLKQILECPVCNYFVLHLDFDLHKNVCLLCKAEGRTNE